MPLIPPSIDSNRQSSDHADGARDQGLAAAVIKDVSLIACLQETELDRLAAQHNHAVRGNIEELHVVLNEDAQFAPRDIDFLNGAGNFQKGTGHLYCLPADDSWGEAPHPVKETIERESSTEVGQPPQSHRLYLLPGSIENQPPRIGKQTECHS